MSFKSVPLFPFPHTAGGGGPSGGRVPKEECGSGSEDKGGRLQ